MLNAAFFLYLFALTVAPLAFGTVETWSMTLMESSVFAAAFLFMMGRYQSPGRPLRQAPGIFFVMLLPAFFLAQMLPMPGEVLAYLSPASFKLYHYAADFLPDNGWRPITLDKKATLNEFFRFSAYGTMFFLTIQFTASRRRLRTTINLMVFTAACVAMLAIAQKVTANGLIYWFRPAPPGNTAMGPFVYHNHFAGYMEMMFPVALCLFLLTRPAANQMPSLRERFIDFFNHPGINTHALAGIAATLIATSIFVSLSRGGDNQPLSLPFSPAAHPQMA